MNIMPTWKRVYCPNCESANIRLEGQTVVVCNVCGAAKALK